MTFDHCLCSRDATSTSTAITTLRQHPPHGPPAWEATGLPSRATCLLSPHTLNTPQAATGHLQVPQTRPGLPATERLREARLSPPRHQPPALPPPTIPTGCLLGLQ